MTFAAPISTTHVMTVSVMGVGTTGRLRAVRWWMAGEIGLGLVTFPAAAAIAAVLIR